MVNVYFFQRLKDKEVFFCEAQEADLNMKKSGLKYLGCSNGQAYERVMAGVKVAAERASKELTMSRRRCDALEAEISKLMTSSEPQSKIDALQKTLDEQIEVLLQKQGALIDIENEYRQKAVAAELAVAKKNKKEQPPNNEWFYFGDIEGAKKAVNQKGYG